MVRTFESAPLLFAGWFFWRRQDGNFAALSRVFIFLSDPAWVIFFGDLSW
jgi:hypothetical protein